MQTCLIFDLDGTLVDSEIYCLQALADLVPDLNFTIEELSRRYRGKKLADIFRDTDSHSQMHAKKKDDVTSAAAGKGIYVS